MYKIIKSIEERETKKKKKTGKNEGNRCYSKKVRAS